LAFVSTALSSYVPLYSPIVVLHYFCLLAGSSQFSLKCISSHFRSFTWSYIPLYTGLLYDPRLKYSPSGVSTVWRPSRDRNSPSDSCVISQHMHSPYFSERITCNQATSQFSVFRFKLFHSVSPKAGWSAWTDRVPPRECWVSGRTLRKLCRLLRWSWITKMIVNGEYVRNVRMSFIGCLKAQS
jgi:hypothetical protein